MIDIYTWHQNFIVLICAGLFALKLAGRISLPFGVAFLYTIISAMFPISQSASSSNAMLFSFISCGLVYIVPTQVVGIYSGVLLIANAVLVLIFGYGIFNAGSFDNSILAAFLFIIINYRKYFNKKLYIPTLILLFVTIIKTQGSTQYFILIASLFGFCLRQKIAISPIIIGIVLAAIGFYTQGNEFLSSNGRLEKWTLFIDWWINNANILIGTGGGSFWWLGPKIQGGAKDLFTFMHNEYLQALFEQGILGFLIYSWLGIDTLIKSWRTGSVLFATSCGILVMMLSQFPFRFLFSTILILLFIKLVNEAYFLSKIIKDERRNT